ncbi:DNA-binding LacI/PurR family transcriptional regulator [Kribbella aluminosa]|uniref:DNA-binding LacI/PurR family transcriptional regulator n=1 Tax=Kribbella aluminosa TaxID=416017 RepID=A0ABS4UZN3_9ACTN|nr:LacI family DNA-binding transcriptional regulator [Kribbella aluminosa]MBP2357011.1 DNA-binding LacI/PurR family transcriptional regulator [Kribbella aluminosa]
MVAQKPRRTTVADVARLAGVSAMTVSNVLNAPHRVAAPTVETVRAAIEELGYIPNHAARALSSGRSQVIGLPLYFDDEDDADDTGLGGFLHGLLGGLVKAAAVSGYGVHVTTPTDGATEIALYEKLIAARQVDAIVVLETMPHDPRIEFLSRRRFPFVAFGQTAADQRQCWVDVDNATSMAGIADYLQSTGRERAVYLATDSALPWVHQRRDGFVRGFPATEVRSFGSLEAVAAYLGDAEVPDAIVADNDAYAVVAMRTLQRRGIAVGEEVAVTGFNDFPFASMLDTPLTTARIPLQDIARCLFTRALHEIAGEPDEPGRLVPAPLVVRSSA